ncbi:hypothetical protein cypCar_00029103 [Cyprinus carpio]|nr:hypothetical protein cypCar_00029103 [Cyprinus carpio]
MVCCCTAVPHLRPTKVPLPLLVSQEILQTCEILSKSERPPFSGYGREPGVSGCQSSMRSDIGLASPRPVTTSGKSPTPFYSYTGSNPRRRSLQDSASLDPLQTKKVRKPPPGLPTSVSTASFHLPAIALI